MSLEQLGIDPLKFVAQIALAFLFLGLPAIYATTRVLRTFVDAPLALWLLLIWFFPVVGPISAICAARSRTAS